MSTRTILLAVAGAASGLTCGSAVAGDFAVSFLYRSHSPSYYSRGCAARYYARCTPTTYGYYGLAGGPYACGGFYGEPLVYLAPPVSPVTVYGGCYPRPYRTTYTRSRCYTFPPIRSAIRGYAGLGIGGYAYGRSAYGCTVVPPRRHYDRSPRRIYTRDSYRRGSHDRRTFSYDRRTFSYNRGHTVRHGGLSIGRQHTAHTIRSSAGRGHGSHGGHRGSSGRFRPGR